jgi:hypothetical protein
VSNEAKLGSQAESLVERIDSENPYDYDFWEILPRQIEAISERFKDQAGKIKVVQNRAESGGVSEIRELRDVVPLLLAHTAYKSYPEKWLFDQKWAMLGRWLDTVSTNRVLPIEGEVRGLDHWLERLEEQGHFMGTSSGTTGKVAMMNNTRADLDRAGKDLLTIVKWCGPNPANDRQVISLGQVAASARNMASGLPLIMALSAPGHPPISPDVPAITVGGILEMVLLRKQMADGTAKPSDIAKYEAETASRQESMSSAVEQAVEAIIANRDMPLHIMGMTGPLYQVAEKVRARGYSGKDFQPNSSFLSGGLKREVLPENYKEIIYDTLNFSDERVCQSYSMQEVNSQSPRCSAGRYHIPPWLVLLLLDESGENLIEPVRTGEVEGRAGLFDLALEGRWGGVISGDKVKAQWEPCACGNRSPSLNHEIKRYADTEGGDKIACSGTIDAYVRGAAT